MDGWAGAEQVEMKMLSVNLSGGCLLQVRPERRSRMTLSWRQTPGSQCQSNLQTENTTLKKPWIWLYWITDLSHTHSHTLTRTHTQGSWGPVKWAAELLGILSESSSEGDCGARERNDAGGRWGKRRRQKHSVQKRSVSDSRTSYFQAYLKSRCRNI